MNTRHTTIAALTTVAVLGIVLAIYNVQFRGHLSWIDDLGFQPFHLEIAEHNSSVASCIKQDLRLGTQKRLFQNKAIGKAMIGDDPSLLGQAKLQPNHGFIRLKDKKTQHVRWYGVSMFHQLHCLDMIRERLEQTKAAQEGQGTEMFSHHHQHDSNQSTWEHLFHCLDYIAQAVACTADDTVEFSKVENIHGVPRLIVDGDNETHYCRDFDKVAAIMESSDKEPVEVVDVAPGDTIMMLASRAGRVVDVTT
ncbi:hypothetical protein F5Y01DRAFT_287476 [Xylaria sp. FL0043]|nr:hypothetical protein F5Y01DRAFT_287476 [Xylaria sp. FL0043]